MMPYNKKNIVSFTVFLLVLVLIFSVILRRKRSNDFMIKEIRPKKGDVSIIISTTGIVEPQNRLEVKPPISGRVEKIYVREGNLVKQGQVLAEMSSTERAALLDAATAQGEEAVAYWKDVYKATPLISPIDGEVIVRAVEPGQTVTAETAIIVISDRLIVNAQVDETDIGRIKAKQRSVISLDAYPRDKIESVVGHIAYESKLINNVTIYEVDIIPSEIPDYFRSGMSATVDIIEEEKKNVLVLPLKAIIVEEDGNYVLIKDKESKKPVKTKIELGLKGSTDTEVTHGVTENDIVIIEKKRYVLPRKGSSANPFFPSRKKR